MPKQKVPDDFVNPLITSLLVLMSILQLLIVKLDNFIKLMLRSTSFDSFLLVLFPFIFSFNLLLKNLHLLLASLNSSQ